jgi:nitroreductase
LRKKDASNFGPVIEAIRSRRSVRGYQPGPVAREQIETIVDCGRLAPSAFNEQKWEFIVVENPKTLKTIASFAPDNCPFLSDASACIIVSGDKKHSSVYLDGAAAAENMLLAAHALELGACWVQAHDKPYNDAIMKLLKIPTGQVLVAMISIGVPFGKVKTPQKRLLKDVLHWEKY